VQNEREEAKGTFEQERVNLGTLSTLVKGGEILSHEAGAQEGKERKIPLLYREKGKVKV